MARRSLLLDYSDTAYRKRSVLLGVKALEPGYLGQPQVRFLLILRLGPVLNLSTAQFPKNKMERTIATNLPSQSAVRTE